jgi:hypothetical protein
MMDQQLIQFLELIKADVINAMQARGIDATHQTAKQLSITTDGNTLQLALPGYMQLLETGRGPTSTNAIAGDPPMIQRIQQWCREKGIPDKAAWAIKKSIDKKGYKGKPGILSEPLSDDNINSRLEMALPGTTNAIIEQIVNALTK